MILNRDFFWYTDHEQFFFLLYLRGGSGGGGVLLCLLGGNKFINFGNESGAIAVYPLLWLLNLLRTSFYRTRNSGGVVF